MKKVFILLIVSIVVLTGCNSSNYSSTITYEKENYEDVTVTSSYMSEEIEAKSETKHEEYKTSTGAYSSFTLVCGDQIEADKQYKIEIESNIDVNWEMDLQAVGTGANTAEGEILENNEKFVCKEGYEIDIHDGNTGIIRLYEITPAVEYVPAQEVETSLTYTYTENGEKEEATCYESIAEEKKEVSCENIPNFDEMNAEIDLQSSSQQTTSTVTEKMTLDSDSDELICTIDGIEIDDCKQLVNYEELKKSIDKQVSSEE